MAHPHVFERIFNINNYQKYDHQSNGDTQESTKEEIMAGENESLGWFDNTINDLPLHTPCTKCSNDPQYVAERQELLRVMEKYLEETNDSSPPIEESTWSRSVRFILNNYTSIKNKLAMPKNTSKTTEKVKVISSLVKRICNKKKKFCKENLPPGKQKRTSRIKTNSNSSTQNSTPVEKPKKKTRKRIYCTNRTPNWKSIRISPRRP